MSSGYQLAAIMFTDLVGYTALMGQDEKKALQLLQKNRKIHKKALRKYNGTWLKEIGDGVLMRFQSASEAVYCAAEIIRESKKQDYILRIGIHLGEIVEENGDVFGDGVNVASRIESLAEPGRIWISDSVAKNVQNKPGIKCTSLGARKLKNVAEPIQVFEVQVDKDNAQPYINKSLKFYLRRPLRWAAILGLFLIMMLAGNKWFAGGMSGTTIDEVGVFPSRSIAVLPFVNMSSDPENEYFSDGLSEELLNALAKVESMKVAGRTSSFKFKGKNENITEIGAELGVGHVLEGSVRKSGNLVRITAQLIKVENGYHVWSETYDRELNDIFAVQEEISRAVLNELKVRLLPADNLELETIPTRDMEAYQIYLKANQLMVDRDLENINIAVNLYQNAIKLDPTFAQAYARLAIAYNLQAYYGYKSDNEILGDMKNAVETAMALNENVGVAYAARGLYYYTINDKEKAVEDYKKSIRLNPNLLDVYNWLANLYMDELQKPDEARELYRKMYNIDPLAPMSIFNWARMNFREGNLEMANKMLEKNLSINPGFRPSYVALSEIKSRHYGQYDEAFIVAHQAYKLDPSFVPYQANRLEMAINLNMRAPAEYYFNKLREDFSNNFRYFQITGYYGYYTGDYTGFEEDLLKALDTGINYPLGQDFYFYLTDYLLTKNNPEMAFGLINRYDNSLLSDTVSALEDHNFAIAQGLIEYYRKTQNYEMEKRFEDLFCDYAERVEEINPDSDHNREVQTACHFYQENYREAVPYIEEQINRKILGASHVAWTKNLHALDALERNSDIRRLKEEIFTALANQRRNVINFLKEEGDWMAEWDEGQ